MKLITHPGRANDQHIMIKKIIYHRLYPASVSNDSLQTTKGTCPNEMWLIGTYKMYYKSKFSISRKVILLSNDTTYLVMINV